MSSTPSQVALAARRIDGFVAAMHNARTRQARRAAAERCGNPDSGFARVARQIEAYVASWRRT